MLRVELKNPLLNRALLTLDGEFPYVRKWVRHLLFHKGILGFCTVFKNLKSWALQLISGNRDYAVEWFSKDVFLGFTIPRKYKTLFQLIVAEILNPNTKVAAKRLRKYLSILNLSHTFFGPTQSEFCRQIEQVHQKAVYPSNHNDYLKIVRIVCRAMRVNLSSQEGQLAPSGQTVALSPGKNGDWGRFCLEVIYSKYGREHLKRLNEAPEFSTDEFSPYGSEGFLRTLWGLGSLGPKSFLQEAIKLGDTSWMGNLTAIGESGLKTRLILVGNPFVQSKLIPLKKRLLQILKEIPTDCTFRQDEGVEWLKNQLRMGHKIYSIDLKDCSWNLPSSLQEEILIQSGVSKALRDLLFRTRVWDPLSQEFLIVEKGQAMGLGPSFPLFSLLHEYLLCAFCMAEGVSGTETFRILGDDIVISNKNVYHSYRRFLHDYQVPISVSKTFESNLLGEFAGKVIYRGEDITPLRWRYLTWESVSSIYWIYRSVLGLQSINIMLKSKKDRFALAVLSPIPKKFGGLGIQKLGDHETASVISVRKGILREISLRGKEGTSSGYPKIPHHLYKPTLDISSPPSFRDISKTLMETNNFRETEWGVLPELCPNPYNFLKQVGKDLQGLPYREKYNPQIQFRFRFKSYHSRESWIDLLYRCCEEEQKNVQSYDKKNDGQVVPDSETGSIKYWFSGPNRKT